MNAVRCPQCRLPLTEEEAASGSCSSCGHELPKREAPESKSKAAPTASHDPAIPWLAAGVSLLVAMVAVAWTFTRSAGPVESANGVSPARLAKTEADLESARAKEIELLGKMSDFEAAQSKAASEREATLADAGKTRRNSISSPRT